MDFITVYRTETLQSLHYNLNVYPPLIPKQYVLFLYSRVLNLTDQNIIFEINNFQKPYVRVLQLFSSLLLALNQYGVNYTISEYRKPQNVVTYEKIKLGIIKEYMRSSPMWALNENKIVKIPKPVSDYVCSVTDYEDMNALIKRSMVIRRYLKLVK